jgi:uncharacterized protein (TIGR01319 family)
MRLTLAIDFGSTYTKVVALDLAAEQLVGVAQAVSTVNTDITIGLRTALEKLQMVVGAGKLNADRILACSSAAGGLRVVAVGLVRELTTKAAEEAALGAGAKIVGTYSHGLSPDDAGRLEQTAPDIILLTGGTDGGDDKVILHNAAALATCKLSSPVIIAGNKIVAQEAQSFLHMAGKYAVIAENVLPELDRLNVEPARAAIRDIFMQRITHAKGLDKAQALVGDIIMPTPMAVLKGAALLAQGTEGEGGLGDLIIVDVGGATTDVHSVGNGYSSRQGVIIKGLPEPYIKRTVEGDLGIRYNARSILEIAGQKKLMEKLAFSNRPLPEKIDFDARVEYLSTHIGAVPQNEEQSLIDIALASAAVNIATQRHAGKIEEMYFPVGEVWIQYGKDLTKTKSVIGTGGIFAYGQESRCLLRAACYNQNSPMSLRPMDPEFFVDEKYILYAVGLLADVAPTEALRIMKKHLKRL